MIAVVGYEGKYSVTEDGRVWSHFYRRWMRGTLAMVGYWYVALRKNGETSHVLVHRLVAEAYLPNPDGKRTVNHKDGNKQNNRTSNLEWATDGEQQVHALATGLSSNSGELHYAAKLSSVDVEYIRSLKGVSTPKEIAAMYGVTPLHVSDILAGRRRAGNGITK